MNDLKDLAVILQHHAGSKPPLQADLGCSELLSLSRALQDLLGCEGEALLVLERAEPTGPYAIVCEVDISVYDKRYDIAASLFPQGIGESKETQRLLPQTFQLIAINLQ
jgi:hypothetical protein